MTDDEKFHGRLFILRMACNIIYEIVNNYIDKNLPGVPVEMLDKYKLFPDCFEHRLWKYGETIIEVKDIEWVRLKNGDDDVAEPDELLLSDTGSFNYVASKISVKVSTRWRYCNTPLEIFLPPGRSLNEQEKKMVCDACEEFVKWVKTEMDE